MEYFRGITNAITGEYTVEPFTPEEILAIESYRLVTSAADVREKRNQLLAESDWTQVLDAPVNRELWAVYRQELRDITSQQGFPTDVVWPVKPN
jgi:hypothetical protein